MPIRFFSTWLIAFLLTIQYSHAQVLNMDKVTAPTDSIKKWKVTSAAGTDFSSEKKVFDSDTKIDITRFLKKKHILSTLFSNSFTKTNGKDIQDLGYVHLRYRDNDSRKISPEFFSQFQWDHLRGMQNRYLIGSNLRLMFVESKSLDLYVGIGLMYEWEKWNFDGVDSNKLPILHPKYIQTKLVKMNQYVKVSTKLFKTTELTFTNFIQARLNDQFVSPRIADFLQWNIPLTKKISINVNFDCIYDVAPIVPIKHYYYNYTTGFAIAI